MSRAAAPPIKPIRSPEWRKIPDPLQFRFRRGLHHAQLKPAAVGGPTKNPGANCGIITIVHSTMRIRSRAAKKPNVSTRGEKVHANRAKLVVLCVLSTTGRSRHGSISAACVPSFRHRRGMMEAAAINATRRSWLLRHFFRAQASCPAPLAPRRKFHATSWRFVVAPRRRTAARIGQAAFRRSDWRSTCNCYKGCVAGGGTAIAGHQIHHGSGDAVRYTFSSRRSVPAPNLACAIRLNDGSKAGFRSGGLCRVAFRMGPATPVLHAAVSVSRPRVVRRRVAMAQPVGADACALLLPR